MVIDTSYNVYTDANGGDPDSTNPKLLSYHKFLWSKNLPSGKLFKPSDDKTSLRIPLYEKLKVLNHFLE